MIVTLFPTVFLSSSLYFREQKIWEIQGRKRKRRMKESGMIGK
jgi:hypothetical protein